MKTLDRFWHWQRNERPTPERTREMRAKHLSPLAEHSIQLALKELVRRRPVDQDLEQLDEQLVTLSLAFCRAIGAMHEAVPEPVKPTEPLPWYRPLLAEHERRELLKLTDQSSRVFEEAFLKRRYSQPARS